MKRATSFGRQLSWLLVIGGCLLTALVAVLVVFFLPSYWGRIPLPISVLAAGAALVVLPRVCHALTGSLAAAFAPVLVWFLVTGWLLATRNAMYLQLPLVIGDWRVLLLMAVGGLSAATSIGRLWGDATNERVRREVGPASRSDRRAT